MKMLLHTQPAHTPSAGSRLLRSVALMGCVSLSFLLAQCGGSSLPDAGTGTTTPTPQPFAQQQVRLTLAAGMAEVEPDTNVAAVSATGLARLGVEAGEISRVYRLETPIDRDFRFSLVASRAGNAGETTVNIAHKNADQEVPTGGIETMLVEGVRVESPGAASDGTWMRTSGDGFARVNITGRIERPQTLIVEVPQPDGSMDVVAVEIEVGDESEINVDEPVVGDGVVESEATIFSSDSWQFGLPAIGVSGDRYSVATYDGENFNGFGFVANERYRRWIQYNATTDEVTGGLGNSSWDGGFWRDQEVAALGNVLAVVYTGSGAVRADVSLDRGASFPISQELDQTSWGQRLVNVAIGPDYTLGMIYWRTQDTSNDWRNIRNELVLVEATPGPLDVNNTPSSYIFGTPQVLYSSQKSVTPLVMHMEYSEAGDLVIGYGYTAVTNSDTGQPFVETRASYRIASRLFGTTVFNDRELDFEIGVMPTDPTVALIGSGPNMQIFYAYDKSDGIYLLHSTDAGMNWSPAIRTGMPGAYQPSVHARMQGTELRVDLLYLETTQKGLELHDLRWSDFAGAPATSEVVRLTTATSEKTGQSTSGRFATGIPFEEVKTTQVAWFGYDAVTDGDDVAIVVHEQTDFWSDFMFVGAPVFGGGFGPVFFSEGMDAATAGGAQAAPPAILLPGMGGAVDAPNADHRNQLKLLVVD